jgi:TolA-binding protein
MQHLKKVVVIGAMSMASILYAYEPSVYGAGDINAAEPYGLTETEQTVLNNKNMLQQLLNKMNDQQRKMDGLMSIIEGQNKEILELKERLSILEKSTQQEEDTNKSYTLMLEMGEMLDKINNTYVTQEQLKEALAGSRSRSVNRGSSDLGTQINTTQIRGNSADIYRKGVQLFSQRSYGAAKDHFTKALEDGYKPAASNYYLGEIAYYTFDYDTAVAHYKESASLYDKASYMPVLYLHTAISLAKIGETEQANSFFEHVIETYPNTRAATIAKKRISK